MIAIPVASQERLPCRRRKVLAGGHGLAQGRERGAGGEHRLVRRGCGGADRHPVLGDQARQLGRRRPLDQKRRGAGVQREEQHRAEPEREGERRRAGEHVVRCRAQHVARERVAHRDHVAVLVHRGLRPARRTGRERKQGHVVARGRHVVEGGGLRRDSLGEVVGCLSAVRDRRQPQPGCRIEEAMVDQCRVERRDLVDRRQLACAQQRHRRDHHATGLEHAEPAGGQPRVVRAAQQHAVAWHETEVVDQHVGHGIGAGQQVGVRPGRAVLADQARPVAPVPGDHVVEECCRAVQPVRVGELREREEQLGPLVSRRQVVAAEGVDVRRREQAHGGHAIALS